jgi:hypothetical protein
VVTDPYATSVMHYGKLVVRRVSESSYFAVCVFFQTTNVYFVVCFFFVLVDGVGAECSPDTK